MQLGMVISLLIVTSALPKHAEAGFGVVWNCLGDIFGGDFGNVLKTVGGTIDEVGKVVAPFIPGGIGPILQQGSDLVEQIVRPKQRKVSYARMRQQKISEALTTVKSVRKAADQYMEDKNAAALKATLNKVNVDAVGKKIDEAASDPAGEEDLPTTSKMRKSRMLVDARVQAKSRKAVMEMSAELDQNGQALLGLSYALASSERNLGEGIAQLKQLNRVQQIEKLNEQQEVEQKEMSLATVEMIEDMQRELLGVEPEDESAGANLDAAKKSSMQLSRDLLNDLQFVTTSATLNDSEVLKMCQRANDLESELSNMKAAIGETHRGPKDSAAFEKIRSTGFIAFAELEKLVAELATETQHFEEETYKVSSVALLYQAASVEAWTCIESFRNLVSEPSTKSLLQKLFDVRAARSNEWKEQAHDLKSKILDPRSGATMCLGKLEAAVKGTERGSNVFKELLKQFEAQYPEPRQWPEPAPLGLTRSVPTLAKVIVRQLDVLVSWKAIADTIEIIQREISNPPKQQPGQPSAGTDDLLIDADFIHARKLAVATAVRETIKSTFPLCAMKQHVYEATRNLRIICDNDAQIDPRERTCPRLTAKRSIGGNMTKRGVTAATLDCLPKPRFEAGTYCQFNCLWDADAGSSGKTAAYRPFVCGLSGTWNVQQTMKQIKRCNREALGLAKRRPGGDYYGQ